MIIKRIKIITLILGVVLLFQNSILLAQSNETQIANAFLQLHKNSKLNAVETIKLDFKTFHTQGMTALTLSLEYAAPAKRRRAAHGRWPHQNLSGGRACFHTSRAG